MERLLRRLGMLGGRGAIVGPRGSGKTTLLGELRRELEGRGFHVVLARLGERRPRIDPVLAAEMPAADAVLLDGAERPRPLEWHRLQRRLLHVPILVVTTHRPGRLPTLLETSTNPVLLEDLVGELAPARLADLRPELAALHRRHRGDLHRVLLELYDLASPGPGQPSQA